jgi:dTDP-glucose 4,6-dehydratase
MNLDGKKALVTGGGGFIGSHLVEALLRKGCNVVALVHYNSFNRWGWLDSLHKEMLKEIEIFSGDIRDPYGVKKAMTNTNVVFHLAALIGIPYSYHSPEAYVDTNVKGTLNILQAARELEIERIVHTSTSEVYGTAQFVPITEEHPINPQSPYAATKTAADFLSLSFYRSFNLPVTVIRPFNTFGPRQSARAIVPTIISQILANEKRVSLGSLDPTRDLNFVMDTVEGFLRAAEANTAFGEVINIGTGHDVSMGNLAKRISELMGVDIEIYEDPKRIRPDKSEVGRLCAANQKARSLLQWSPKYSLDDGLGQTIEWFRKKDNLALYKSNIYNI